MSQENVELVQRVYDAVTRDDAETVLALYDSQATFDFTRSRFESIVDHPVYHGHDGLKSFFRERRDAWAAIDDVYEELIDVGDQVVSVVTSRGRGRASGVAVEMTHYGVWSIRAGKIVRVEWFGTRGEALEAVGLSE